MNRHSESEEEFPVWKNEITSFRSRYADDDSSEEELKLQIRTVPAAKLIVDQPTIAKTIMPQKCAVAVSQDIIKDVDRKVTAWIQNKLDGTNVAYLKVIIDSIKEHQNIYQEFLDLHNVLQQLNLELLNMFDNYVCFVGHEDEAQMMRLSRLASSRAVSHLKSKNHANGPLTIKRLVEAGDKLFSYYQEENQEIARKEEELVNHVATDIIKTYETKMSAYLKEDQNHFENIHRNMLQYCIRMINHILDFSAKINSIHSEKTIVMENFIAAHFLELKQQCESSQNLLQAATNVSSISNSVHSIDPATPSVLPSSSKPMPPLLPPKLSTLAQPKMNTPSQDESIATRNDAKTVHQPINKTQVATFEYKNTMDSRWQRFADHNQLKRCHDETMSRLINNLNSTEKQSAITQMNYYYNYISERFEDARSDSGKARKFICVSFTNDGIRLGAYTDKKPERNSRDWVFHPETSFATTKLKFKDKQVLDLVELFLVGPKENHKSSKTEIKKIFAAIKVQGHSITGNLDEAMILIPSWLNVEHRAMLRGVAYEAGFKIVSFISESAVTIYSMRNIYATPTSIYLTITVAANGAFVEAYSRDSRNVVKLVAAAAHEWEMQVSKTKSSSISKIFSFFTDNSLNSNKWKNLIGKQANPGAILRSTYDKVHSMLGENVNKGPIQCLYISSSVSQMWTNAYKSLLQSRSELTDIEDFDERLALSAVIKLSGNPQSIREIIVDHTVHVPAVSNAPVRHESEAVTSASSSSVPKKSAPPVPSKLSKLKAPTLRPEAVALLKVCQQIREQVESGEQRIGVLMRRMAIETVERAESVCSDVNATLDAIVDQNFKVNEIVERHKFSL